MPSKFDDLPHEIVLRIVEWTVLITRADKLREGRRPPRNEAPEDNEHAPQTNAAANGNPAGNAAAHPPPVAPTTDPDPHTIGDAGFMQNLMGFFNYTGQPTGQTAGPGQTAAATAPENAGLDDLPPLETVGQPSAVPSSGSGSASDPVDANETPAGSTSAAPASSTVEGTSAAHPPQPAPSAPDQQDTMMNENSMGVSVDSTDDDDAWEDEDEDEEYEDEDEDMYDSTAALTDEEENDGDEPSRVDPATYTYEDGLPTNSLLPLAFINKSFLNAVRTLLYGRHLHLNDIYQAHLLLRTLQGPIVSVYGSEPDADDDEARFRRTLAYLVRDIRIEPTQCVSLGRGGGSVLVDLVTTCSRLQHVYCGVTWTKSAMPKFIRALAGCVGMRSFAMRGPEGPDPNEATLDLGLLEPLLSTWKELEDIQLIYLDSAPKKFAHQLKPLAGKLSKITLAHPDITNEDLMYLLSSSKGCLDTLEIHRPTCQLTRKGLAKALIKYGSTITNLQIDVGTHWHRETAGVSVAQYSTLTAAQAASTRFLMDGLIGYLPKLIELKLSGGLASVVIIARAPKTLEVLALEDSVGIELTKAITLLKKGLHLKRSATSSKSNPKSRPEPTVLPKLRCLTLARADGAMPSESAMSALVQIMDARQACIHWTYTGSNGPAGVWEGFPGPAEDLPPPGALAMLGGMLGMAMDGPLAPLPPGVDNPFMMGLGGAAAF